MATVKGGHDGATDNVVVDVGIKTRHVAVAVAHIALVLETRPCKEQGVVMELDNGIFLGAGATEFETGHTERNEYVVRNFGSTLEHAADGVVRSVHEGTVLDDQVNGRVVEVDFGSLGREDAAGQVRTTDTGSPDRLHHAAFHAFRLARTVRILVAVIGDGVTAVEQETVNDDLASVQLDLHGAIALCGSVGLGSGFDQGLVLEHVASLEIGGITANDSHRLGDKDIAAVERTEVVTLGNEDGRTSRSGIERLLEVLHRLVGRKAVLAVRTSFLANIIGIGIGGRAQGRSQSHDENFHVFHITPLKFCENIIQKSYRRRCSSRIFSMRVLYFVFTALSLSSVKAFLKDESIIP